MSAHTIPSRISTRRVSHAMHVGVLSCHRDTPLDELAATMSRERVHCIIVESGSGDGGAPWGVVTDLDLVAAATVRELDEQTAGGSAATPLVLVAPGETLERAAQLMNEQATTHLLVVDPVDGIPVGVLSTIDIAAVLAEEVGR